MQHLFFVLLIVLFLNVSFLISPSFAALAAVPKTGQTSSNATGDDGDLQLGVGWPTPRFTDNGNGTVSDNLTGLIWLKNSNCTDIVGGIDKSYNGRLSWQEALTWSNNLASIKCGLSDGSHSGEWRLPNVDELESLLDMGHNFPALPTDQPFTGNVETGIMTELYWSSSTYVGSPYVAWGVYMWGGGVMGALKDSNGFVLPVRSGQVGTPIVTLSIIKSGSGSGEVAVTNGGAICGTNCEPVFTLNSPVTLTATPHILSTFDGWTGCTSIGANGECNVTMSDSKGVTAAFVLAPKAKIGATGYSQLSDAYAYAGATAEILTLNDVLIEDVTLHQDKAITLKGGWNASYSVLTGQTVIKGNLTIQNGSLRANGLKIRQ